MALEHRLPNTNIPWPCGHLGTQVRIFHGLGPFKHRGANIPWVRRCSDRFDCYLRESDDVPIDLIVIEGPLGGAHRRPANYACRDRLWSANSSMPFKEGRLPCKRREKWRSTNLPKYSGKVKTENMKICFKMHARAEVVPNKASKMDNFPLTRQNIL